jgi:cell division protease FtsH
MSAVIGPVSFKQAEEHPFLGKEIHEAREFSEETARVIDEEVQKFLNAAADRARELLTEHRDKLDALAKALVEKEVLDRDDITALWGERPVSPSAGGVSPEHPTKSV